MKVLVTGATGFLGGSLVRSLIKKGRIVKAFVRPESNSAMLRRLGVELCFGDLLCVETLREALRDVETVFHCAAQVALRPTQRLFDTNVQGTKHFLQASLDAGIAKVIHMSSAAVVAGNDAAVITDRMPYAPENDYAVSKIKAEKIAFQFRKKGLKIAIMRPCSIIGPNEPHFLPLLVRMLKSRCMFVVGDARVRWHLVYIDDVVNAVLLAERSDETFHDSYIIAGKEISSKREVLDCMADVLGVRRPWRMPKPLAYGIAALAEAIRRAGIGEIPFTYAVIESFYKDRVFDISHAREQLGYDPQFGVEEAIQRSLSGYVGR